MALDRLAAYGVMAFDRFRRPLTSHERGQRLGAGLSQRQIENLNRWGYPYVFEDFRFHLTLTGPIDADRRGSVLALLQARFDAIDGGHSLPITRLSLLRQDAWSTPFRVVGQAALTAVRSPQQPLPTGDTPSPGANPSIIPLPPLPFSSRCHMRLIGPNCGKKA